MRNEDAMEIDLKDMLLYWLLHYRSLIIAILVGVGACIFIAYSKKLTPAVEEYTDDITTYRVSITDEQNTDIGNLKTKYVTVEGEKGGISKSLAQSIVQSFKENEEGNIVLEVTIVETSSDNDSVTLQTPKTISQKLLIKYGMIGFIIATFAHAALFFIKYSLTGKIKTKSQQQSYLYVQELASVRDAEKNIYRNRGKLDEFIRHIAGYKKCIHYDKSLEDAMEILVLKMKKIINGKKEVGNILIIGRGTSEFKKAISDKLSIEYPQIAINICNKIVNDAGGLNSLLKADCVILAEEYGKTSISGLKEDIELVLQEKVEIVGTVWQ